MLSAAQAGFLQNGDGMITGTTNSVTQVDAWANSVRQWKDSQPFTISPAELGSIISVNHHTVSVNSVWDALRSVIPEDRRAFLDAPGTRQFATRVGISLPTSAYYEMIVNKSNNQSFVNTPYVIVDVKENDARGVLVKDCRVAVVDPADINICSAVRVEFVVHVPHKQFRDGGVLNAYWQSGPEWYSRSTKCGVSNPEDSNSQTSTGSATEFSVVEQQDVPFLQNICRAFGCV